MIAISCSISKELSKLIDIKAAQEGMSKRDILPFIIQNGVDYWEQKKF